MVARQLFESLKNHLLKKEYSILTGARQTGKSTLLRQLEVYCTQKGIPVIFLNLENKSILDELNQSPLNILKFLPETDKRVVVLVDEVQYLDDASNFLKLMYDEHAEKVKIVATGSSAFYIDDAFRDSLAGRKKLFHITTCNFDEYLELSGKAELLNEKNKIIRLKGSKSTKIAYLQNEWENYLIYGGYPAIITEPDKQEKIGRLTDIRDSFIKRDILESGVSNEAAFYNLMRILAAQTGNLLNVNELASTLRIRSETVESYLTVMQKCFHIALVKPFFKNLRKELVKMPKVYMFDNGLRNCLVNNFQMLSARTDCGELWENTVFRILSDNHGLDAVKYWRTISGNEIDFVLPDISEPNAYEVKFGINQVKPNKYASFTEAYPEIPLQFVWLNPFDEDFFRRII
jgi:predicted AAA+ superfamily ATPase